MRPIRPSIVAQGLAIAAAGGLLVATFAAWPSGKRPSGPPEVGPRAGSNRGKPRTAFPEGTIVVRATVILIKPADATDVADAVGSLAPPLWTVRLRVDAELRRTAQAAGLTALVRSPEAELRASRVGDRILLGLDHLEESIARSRLSHVDSADASAPDISEVRFSIRDARKLPGRRD